VSRDLLTIRSSSGNGEVVRARDGGSLQIPYSASRRNHAGEPLVGCQQLNNSESQRPDATQSWQQLGNAINDVNVFGRTTQDGLGVRANKLVESRRAEARCDKPSQVSFFTNGEQRAHAVKVNPPRASPTTCLSNRARERRRRDSEHALIPFSWVNGFEFDPQLRAQLRHDSRTGRCADSGLAPIARRDDNGSESDARAINGSHHRGKTLATNDDIEGAVREILPLRGSAPTHHD
jgi:hypothetical protein